MSAVNTTESKATHSDAQMKGWLFKWTNYIKGYQKRWFVLSNGLLSYYRNQAEMAHTCRGTISLRGAIIQTEDSCAFIISNGVQTFHIKASNEIERQRWVTTLELAKSKATSSAESDDEDFESDGEVKLENIIKTLSVKLEQLQSYNDIINKHGAALHRTLTELESCDNPQELQSQIKEINERATLFRITTNAMINSCGKYLEIAQTQGGKWQRMLQHERDQRLKLEELVEQMARIPHPSSRNTRIGEGPPIDEDDDEDDGVFYDAVSENGNVDNSTRVIIEPVRIPKHYPYIIPLSYLYPAMLETTREMDTDSSTSEIDEMVPSSHNTTSSLATVSENQNTERAQLELNKVLEHPWKIGSPRRNIIPEKPVGSSMHIWTILKNCIGKDLSTIPMPIHFSEPLSMLQRLTEDFEYANVLDEAALCDDPYKQHALVAAFSASAYSTTAVRTGKPFNPLLGETYECDRTADLGWKCFSEQVSHHPPVAAQYIEGKNWKAWQDLSVQSKFRGKYIQVNPIGSFHVVFTKSNHHYSWNRVQSTVHNIIVGSLWVDQHGESDIINRTNGAKCRLTFFPYSYFSRQIQRKVKGSVETKEGQNKWIVQGNWDTKMEILPIVNGEEGTPSIVWEKNENLQTQYYSFTRFACQLNEMEEHIAPTDSRLRPDQRLLELGLYDEATREKLRLEEKQRAKRRTEMANFERRIRNGANHSPNTSLDNEDSTSHSDDSSTYKPIWFKRRTDEITNETSFQYTNEYWECKNKKDWSRCPDIF